MAQAVVPVVVALTPYIVKYVEEKLKEKKEKSKQSVEIIGSGLKEKIFSKLMLVPIDVMIQIGRDLQVLEKQNLTTDEIISALAYKYPEIAEILYSEICS